MKKALFLLFAVFPVVFAGAGCGGQEAKANFSAVPQISSQELLQVRELLRKAEIQKQKAALNEALVKKLKEENAKLEQKVEKLAKTAKAESSSLKEFEETNSFIKKSGEALKPALETEEAKKKEVSSLTLPSANADYCEKLFREKRDWVDREWPNLRERNKWRGAHWYWDILPDYNANDGYGRMGVGIYYRLSYNRCFYPYKIVDSSFISNDELMAEPMPAQKSPKKGKTKPL